MKTKVKFLHKNATFKKAYPNDSGYDLTACGYEYKDNGLWHIKLGVTIEPPEGFYFEVVPRSSFSKYPFMLSNSIGIIDQHYRGELRFPVRHLKNLIWYNDKSNSIKDFPNDTALTDIKKYLLGNRIAQAILRKYYDSEIEIVEVDQLTETERGANGFGSTGK